MKNKNFIKFILVIVILCSFVMPSHASFAACLGPDCPDLTLNGSDNSVGGGGSGFLCSLVSNPKFDGLINYITCLISRSVIPLIFTLAFAMFVWGVVQYVMNGTEEAKREKGKQFMLWGIIALFVMFSVWGLVRVLGNTFNINYAVPQVRP